MLRNPWSVLALFLALCSCEIPGDAAPVAPKASEPAKRVGDSGPAAKKVDEPAAKKADRQSATRTIDGRVPPRLRAKEPEPAIASLVEFRDPGAPAPFSPPDGTAVVTARKELIAKPARRDGSIDALVVDAADGDAEWEASLIGRGANVLDRTMLSVFERELYLQEALVSEQDGVALARPEPLLAPGLPVVGRARYAELGAGLWMRVGGQGFQPLLSGRAVPPASRLQVGVAESASAVLRVDEPAWREDKVTVVVPKPVARSIAYRAQLGDEVELVAEDGMWKFDATDPWQRRCSGGAVYFDASTKALWRLDRAWLGGPVTREAYIKARTRDDSPLCSTCRRPLPGKQKVVAPDEASTPATWWCPECDQSQAVAYFDGYALSGAAHDHDHAVVEWQWVAPKPGLYPVLTPPAGRGLAQAFELGGAAGWTHADLTSSLAPAKLLGEEAPRWCWVRADGSAVLLDPEEFQALARRVDEGRQLLRMPACDAAGVQRYELEREPVELATCVIPVSAVELKVRLGMTATTRLVMAGRFALDYRNLLPSDVKVRVGVDGPDLGSWPGAEEQRAALLARLRELLSDAVVK